MYKFVAYSCMAATVAYATPSPTADAEAWHGAGLGYSTGLGYGAGLGYSAGLAHAPAVAVARPVIKTVTKTVTTPKCSVTYETIESQNCVPKSEKVCDTKEVEQESVTYEKECKEVTSKACGPQSYGGIIKREAEADAWHGASLGYGARAGLGYGARAGLGYGASYAAAPVAKVAKATSHVTIKSDCREVTKEVCVNTPKKVTKTVPVTSCHTEQDVVCTPVTKKIPKKVCEPVETKVTVPVATVAHAAPVAGLASGHLW